MTTSNDDVGFHWLALLAACAFPGAGHFVRGEKSRAAAVCTGVMGLFLGGMLVGGIDVIDSKEDRPWFYAQALVGPAAFGVDWVHQNKLKVVDANGRLRSAYPDEVRRDDNAGPVSFIDPVTEKARPFKRGQEIVAPETIGLFSPATIEVKNERNQMVVAQVRGTKSMSVGRVNELGMLMAGLAGMVNLIVIIDAGFPSKRTDGPAAKRNVGLKTTLADAESSANLPTTVDDPLKGETPGKKGGV